MDERDSVLNDCEDTIEDTTTQDIETQGEVETSGENGNANIDTPTQESSNAEEDTTANDSEEDYLAPKPDTKAPLFSIEPRREGCTRNDSLLLTSKKIGFVGLVTFLILSIIMGILTRVWTNCLNLLFMSLAVLAYGIENIIHFFAIKGCNCKDCASEKGKVRMLAIVCAIGAIGLFAIYLTKQILG